MADLPHSQDYNLKLVFKLKWNHEKQLIKIENVSFFIPKGGKSFTGTFFLEG